MRARNLGGGWQTLQCSNCVTNGGAISQWKPFQGKGHLPKRGNGANKIMKMGSCISICTNFPREGKTYALKHSSSGQGSDSDAGGSGTN